MGGRKRKGMGGGELELEWREGGRKGKVGKEGGGVESSGRKRKGGGRVNTHRPSSRQPIFVEGVKLLQ